MTKLPDPPKIKETPDKPPEEGEPNPWAFMPRAPSQQPHAQGPAEKPGEPLAVTFRELPPPPEEQDKFKRAESLKKL